MRWLLTTPRDKRRRKQQAQLLQLQQLHRELLLEALTPVAEAMQRQDNLAQERFQAQMSMSVHQEELLLEVLNSLQPSPESQLFPNHGQSTLPQSYLHWAESHE